MPKDTIEAIKKLKNNGHIPVICTGRTRCMIYREHLLPGFENIVAGAGTYVEISGEQKFLAELDSHEARKVIDGFLECGFVPLAEGRDHLYLGNDLSGLTKANRHVLKVYEENMKERLLTIDAPDLRASKVSALFTNHSDKKKMIEMFEKDYNIVDHNGNLLELIPKKYNKAKGIQRMIELMNIPLENTYAFGDSMNDIDMLTYVRHGCAMGNSLEEIKARVPFVTEDFDKGGISIGLKQFGLI